MKRIIAETRDNFTMPLSIFRGSCFTTVPELAVVAAFVAGNLGKYFVNTGSMVSAGMLTGSW